MNYINKVVIYSSPADDDGLIIYHQLLQDNNGTELSIKKDYSI